MTALFVWPPWGLRAGAGLMLAETQVRRRALEADSVGGRLQEHPGHPLEGGAIDVKPGCSHRWLGAQFLPTGNVLQSALSLIMTHRLRYFGHRLSIWVAARAHQAQQQAAEVSALSLPAQAARIQAALFKVKAKAKAKAAAALEERAWQERAAAQAETARVELAAKSEAEAAVKLAAADMAKVRRLPQHPGPALSIRDQDEAGESHHDGVVR